MTATNEQDFGVWFRLDERSKPDEEFVIVGGDDQTKVVPPKTAQNVPKTVQDEPKTMQDKPLSPAHVQDAKKGEEEEEEEEEAMHTPVVPTIMCPRFRHQTAVELTELRTREYPPKHEIPSPPQPRSRSNGVLTFCWLIGTVIATIACCCKCQPTQTDTDPDQQ